MKIGVSIKINYDDIDKSRLFQGSKGKYLDITTFIDTDNQGQYGDNGFITQSPTKEERQQKVQLPILGNATVFYTDTANNAAQPAGIQQAHNTMNQQQAPQGQQPAPLNNQGDMCPGCGYEVSNCQCPPF